MFPQELRDGLADFENHTEIVLWLDNSDGAIDIAYPAGERAVMKFPSSSYWQTGLVPQELFGFTFVYGYYWTLYFRYVFSHYRVSNNNMLNMSFWNP